MFDPIQLEIYKGLFTAVTDEMGVVLQKSAFSPNIKERRDFSCALFDQKGDLVIQSAHIPVHLGSMQVCVKRVMEKVLIDEGDIVMVNDPFMGGTHLPDITLIAGCFHQGKLLFYLANRAHHSDVGGMTPGSMPLSTSIYQEGVRIPPVKIIKNNELNEDVFELLLSNMRNRPEREGDFNAQISSLKIGKKRLDEYLIKYPVDEILNYMTELQNYSERIMRACISGIPDGLYSFSDQMDDDGITDQPINIAVDITISKDQATIDFSQSDNQVTGGINCNLAITTSVVFYVFRSLISMKVPSNAGIMRPLNVITRNGSIVDACFPSGIAGGNVETSQRIVDVLYGALSKALPDRIPSASQGTMNNLSIGGIDINTGKEFSYYETIGGGMGARPGKNGLSAIQTHMTNTWNTPIEALENTYPFEVLRYSIRKHSGGQGKYCGGDGIIREIKVFTPCHATILSERRKNPPYGLQGGENGKSGENYLIRKGIKQNLPSKCNLDLMKDDIIVIQTPGGGGFGKQLL